VAGGRWHCSDAGVNVASCCWCNKQLSSFSLVQHVVVVLVVVLVVLVLVLVLVVVVVVVVVVAAAVSGFTVLKCFALKYKMRIREDRKRSEAI
jgi:uncharacterized BrkB/YihY/UPF0761 family membrane protein